MKQVKYHILTIITLLLSYCSYATGPVTGVYSVCSGTTTTLSDTSAGGVWSSSDATIATVGSISGIVSGVAAGSATITYTTGTGFSVATVSVYAAPSAITISGPLCMGSGATASNSTTGGAWSSSAPTVASVSSSGAITVNSTGTATISYTVGVGCVANTIVTVNPAAPSITGTLGMCAGGTTTLAAPGGGTWSSSNPSVALVSTSGVVTSASIGTANIIYTLPTGCSTYATVTVNVLPSVISGPSSFCAGGTGSYFASPYGGSWSSNYSAIATIGSSSGIATAVVAGSVTISYTLASGCASLSSVTINALPLPITATPAFAGCVGSSVNLSSTAGGTWTSTSTSVATISSGGIASCIAPGTSAITYTLPTGCSANATITVSATPAVFSMSGGGNYCAGSTSVHIGLSGSAGGCTTYQLYLAGTPVGTVIPGTGSSIDFGVLTPAGTYTAMALNSCTGCSSNMAGSATIIINPAPTVYILTTGSGGGYCAGGTGADLTLSGSDPGIMYQVLRFGSFWLAPTSGTGAVLDWGPQPAGTYTAIATNPSTTCTSAMLSTTISVIPAPNVYSVTGGGPYCSGSGGAHIALAASDAGINYQLYMGTSAVGAPAAGTGAGLDLGAHTAAGTYTVVATNATYGCTAAMAGSATISVAPLPFVYNVTGGGSYCPGGGAHVGLLYSAAGYGYQLYRDHIAVGTTVAGINAALDFGMLATPGTYSVIATNLSTGCAAIMADTASLIANPAPVVHNVTGSASYCAGGAGVPIGLDNSNPGIKYKLYNGSTFIASLNGTGAALDYGHRTAAGTYTITAIDTTTSCNDTMHGYATVVINPLPAVYTLTGGGAYCPGGTGSHIGMSGSATGVSYQLYAGSTPSGSPVAGTGSSLDFGIEAIGTYGVTATNTTTGCTATMAGTPVVTLSSLPDVFSMAGGGSYCPGDTGRHVYLSGSISGTAYQLYHNGTPVGSAITGVGTGLDFGLETITGTYTVTATNSTGCTDSMAASAVVGINPALPASLTITAVPGDTVCMGASVTFTANPVNGGSTPAYGFIVNGHTASVGPTYTYIPSTGDVVYAVMTSSATCATPLTSLSEAHEMTVITDPIVSGSSSVCLGGTTTLSSVAGGAFTSSDPAVATVAFVGGTPGVVTGLAVGVTSISYTIAPGCVSVQSISVNPVPVVSATSVAVSCSGDYTLTASGAASYTWSPATALSCTACSVTTSSPTSLVLYHVTGTNAVGCSATDTVSVDANRIAGYISYSGSPSDSLKVWLIQFNPSDSSLTGLDSTYTCMSSGTPYYEFKDVAAGSYIVKAKLLGGTPGTTGYIPTYSRSTPYWYDATSAMHISSSDILNVSLAYGTVPYGPGFIGGLISMGAGRGTSGDVPAPHMTVYLKDALTGVILTYTYTDATGAYAFPNLSYGSYIVYPEDFGYTTTPSGTLTLADFTDTVRGLDFKEHLNARTITPISPAVNGVKSISSNEQLLVYPNPAKDALTISWSNEDTNPADIVISDITGKQVYTTTLNISAASGQQQLTLPALQDGIYLLTIRSQTINYNTKLLIQR